MKTKGQHGPDGQKHLLDAVKSFWLYLGSDLDDNEISLFLRDARLPVEAGFAFMGFSGGCVTLTVPKQDPEDWYSEANWIAREKESIARDVAKKYNLLLSKPVDGPLNFHPPAGTGALHHHLTLADNRQTVIVAHPLFLKIRLFGKSMEHTYGGEPQFPLPLGHELLQDLSPLYPGKLDLTGSLDKAIFTESH
jgi:hypothetical protein